MNFLVNLYALLLRAYPAEFRNEYGMEMRLLFAEMLRDAKDRRGVMGICMVTVRVTIDLIRSATKERLGIADAGERAIWALALIGCAVLVYVTRHATQAQAPMLVLIATTVLLGAYDPSRAWRWALLVGASIPVCDLLLVVVRVQRFSPKILSEFEIVLLALLFTGAGVCARSVLVNFESQQLHDRGSRRIALSFSAMLAGCAMGLCDFTLVSPIFAIVGLVTAGILMGSFVTKPIQPAIWLGFGVPLAIVVQMAMREHPIRPHYVLIDALGILWCAGAAYAASRARDYFGASQNRFEAP